MPIEMKEEDRVDFEKRLAKYGLTTASVLAEKLTTVPSSITSLHAGPTAEGHFRPIALKTSSLDQLVQWIGISDQVFNRSRPGVEIPGRLRFENADRRRGAVELLEADALAKFTKRDLTSEHLTNIRAAMRAYIYGDSRMVEHYRPWIEKAFPSFSIHVWPFIEITVKSGSVLELGSGMHSLVAYKLTIEAGGIVRSYGHMNVNVTILEKTQPVRLIGLDTSLLRANPKFVEPRIIRRQPE